MTRLLVLITVLMLNNCSLNKNSKFWSEDGIKKSVFKKKLEKIMNKSNDLMSLSYDDYKIYVEEYSKKSKYPNITK